MMRVERVAGRWPVTRAAARSVIDLQVRGSGIIPQEAPPCLKGNGGPALVTVHSCGCAREAA